MSGGELERLRARLAEAEETLDAIRAGQIDALVVDSPEGARIFTVACAERPYRVLIEQMGEGAASLTTEGTILFCNRQFARMLGVPDESAAGRRIDAFLSAEDAARLRELSRSPAPEPRRAELTVKRHDGAELPIYLSASMFVDGAQRTLCIIATDLTERKREEAAKARAEAALRQAQKMEAVGQLTGGIAHDFNNLLTAIVGNLDLLGRRIDDGEGSTNVRNATRAALRGARLVEQLLAFSRKQHLVPAPVDVNRVVAGMRELLARSIGPTIQVVTTLSAEAWLAFADATQIEMMLVNLALNARDAMPAGGILHIRTENATVSAGSPVRDLAPGAYLRLSVIDDGTGMTPEARERAVEPFYTTKQVGSGTGLGLSQVYGVAKQFGGTIDIRSRLGAGTTVDVYLPRAAAAEATSPGMTPASAGPHAEASLILVVDDDPDVREAMARSLRELGHATIEVESARQAIEILQRDARIGLLFTDIAMPGMNGFELAEHAARLRPGLGVLLTTGYADVGSLASSSPSARILAKPFRLRELARAVDELLSEDAGGTSGRRH